MHARTDQHFLCRVACRCLPAHRPQPTTGDYPDILKRSINNGDLPSFSEEEKRDLAGSIDFVGVNVYTARYVLSKPGAPDGFRETSKGKDGKDIGFKTNDWLYAVPGALGGVLAYVGLTYNKLQTMVTEFGTNVKGEEDMSDEEVRLQLTLLVLGCGVGVGTVSPRHTPRSLSLGPGLMDGRLG